MLTRKTICLTPPRFTAEHIQEKVVCIRAHRERIFCVRTEQQDTKLICHNYGQGGAGWTFLFGCVNESLRQFEQLCANQPALRTQPIRVIGGGCYGLLTAILLKRAGHTVHISAKDLDDIPSYKAAGFFFPRARKNSTPDERATFLARGMESFRHYQTISNGTHPFITKGAQLLPAYFGPDIDPGFAPYIAQGLMQQPEEVLIDFGSGVHYNATEYHTMFINAADMMQELRREVAALGIPITQQEICSFEELSEPIVFNCAGLGAKKLTNDKLIVPVQGHLITLCNQPDTKQLQYMINVKVTMTDALGKKRDELIYFAPKGEGILGITFKRGVDSLTSNQHEFDRLLQRCHDFFYAQKTTT